MTENKFPIKAYIRIRPGKSCLEYTNTSIKICKDGINQSEYTFDKVFGPCTTQKGIFRCINDSITKFKEGYNTTIFCYGNTGAGKTYTMVGNNKSPGLIQNIIIELLKDSSIKMSYMEIYNEKVYDLLEPKEVYIREQDGKVVVQNICKLDILDYDSFDVVFNKGNTIRRVGQTKLNACSSRSHSILQIERNQTKLYLIDLAGSENNRKTGNVGKRLTESNAINKSLFVLANCVNGVIRCDSRIPYRDSKLTRILQDSLGGSSQCVIIANVIDDLEYVDDTINTLKFASKSRNIINTRSQKSKISEKNQKGKTLCDKTNTPNKKCKTNNDGSSFVIKSSLYDKSDLLLTPTTQEKSCKAFFKRAEEYEKQGNYKKALEDYKVLKKLKDTEYINLKIEEMTKLTNKKQKNKAVQTHRELVDVLNSGKFVLIKKLSGVGDKRAQAIVDYVNGGNYFECATDLKLIFSEKVVQTIIGSIDIHR